MSQITTHILDTARGCPAAEVAITLCRQEQNTWVIMGEGITNEDGRVADLCPQDLVLPAGTYRMHFATAAYFQRHGQTVFYPWAEVVFNIEEDGAHYHIPLLLSGFGYSTYRGS
ncbi:hydroxyisourate hydrolase [Halioglobus japonicus]|uniref:5-hydroxyisourate hydrolase n=1 Tax=Halioglobus japonicus TaxID=930805 RepID=A0AAP8MD87_9GAMM|nr:MULTISPECIES: hydroxyisourate hydrolase [Halioglobus]AQA17711.1 hydroxyisourate hydrolase [Halioglobus japonicus]KZX57090.1 hydroxyisourate hydrolase [Halioglobus sp. HI00S01]PLW85662.1 hydroxyisourate hydrolase [Halioglobus japonicus]GHD16813.1 5-hydroxyisourate hydrolase [Halioglobus japonicus]